MNEQLLSIVQALQPNGHLAYAGVQYDLNKASSVASLGEAFYQNLHCRQANRTFAFAPSLLEAQRNFEELLAAKNTTTGTWDPEWVLEEALSDGSLRLKKESLLAVRVRNDHFWTEDGERLKGKIGYAFLPGEWRNLLPGFYVAHGSSPRRQHEATHVITRLYFNIRSSIAPVFVHETTSRLNRLEIPYMLKVLKAPDSYPRSDAAVLFVYKDTLQRCLPAFQPLYRVICTRLNDATPFFAKRIVRGVAVAEELSVRHHESFGQNRSRLLAEGLAAINRGLQMSSDQVLDKLSDYFAERSIDILRPYMKDGREDDYDALLDAHRTFA